MEAKPDAGNQMQACIDETLPRLRRIDGGGLRQLLALAKGCGDLPQDRQPGEVL